MNPRDADTKGPTEPTAINAWNEGRTIYVEPHDGE